MVSPVEVAQRAGLAMAMVAEVMIGLMRLERHSSEATRSHGHRRYDHEQKKSTLETEPMSLTPSWMRMAMSMRMVLVSMLASKDEASV